MVKGYTAKSMFLREGRSGGGGGGGGGVHGQMVTGLQCCKTAFNFYNYIKNENSYRTKILQSHNKM